LKQEAITPELLAQIKLSVMLGYGFVLSLSGVGGLGSLVGFGLGLEARRRIKKSRGQFAGANLAWWCIFLGAAGAIWRAIHFAEWLRQIGDPLK
jgi:hypothetical protein